jgi:hypothetical protein
MAQRAHVLTEGVSSPAKVGKFREIWPGAYRRGAEVSTTNALCLAAPDRHHQQAAENAYLRHAD